MITSSPGVIGQYRYCSCSISRVSLSREPAQEYGTSACPIGPGCSISPVSLSRGPARDYRASLCPRGPGFSMSPVPQPSGPV